MRRETFFVLAALFLCGIFFSIEKNIALASVVINEIGAYEASGFEWIEIWNSGSEPIDMSNWKFYENSTNHSLSVSSTDSIVEPDEYAAICQDEENFLSIYPDFNGSIFDSSWGSLNESGEEIGLKDAESNLVLLFSYPAAPDYSLELIDPFTSSGDPYNWREHSASNTLGSVNSCFGELLPGSTTTPPDTTSTPPEATSTPPAATSTYDPAVWFSLKINEFVSDPESGNEWIEIYQTGTSSLDLNGAQICDSRETSCKTASGTVQALGFFVVDLYTSSFLNNDGDSVILKNASGTIIDRVDYSVPYTPAKGQSLARLRDGVDSDAISDWAITTRITPAASNVIQAPPKPTSGVGGVVSPEPSLSEEENSAVIVVSDGLVINEIFPNPIGADEEGEFIELINTSSEKITLNGWKIADSVRQYDLRGEILPGQILVWSRIQTKIALNNSTAEEVKLISPDGKTADIIKYTGAKEGEAYVRGNNNLWKWTAEPTPGEINILSQTETGGIVWKISAPSSARPGEVLVFDAEDSADERGGLINFVWDFGDGSAAVGGEVTHAFSATGTFVITVNASSSAQSSSIKKIKIEIGEILSQDNNKVIINEILSDPLDDETREFIELVNNGHFPVDLSGWKLRNKTKNYAFPQGTLISPGQILVFFRRVTGFVLNNEGDRVELINRDGDILDLVKAGKAREGMSYSFFGNEWQWTSIVTPGLQNIMSATMNISSASKASQKVGPIYRQMAIAEARQEDPGSAVLVRGMVAALPGNFGVQYFYIIDESAGIQIYCYKKDFPDLKVGDLIEVKGEISEAQDVKRIKIAARSAIDILATENNLVPANFSLDEIEEEDRGRLIAISGEITETKSSYFFLDDGVGEIKVYFKKGAAIDKSQFEAGEKVKVTGIAESGQGEIQLWPRGESDIKVLVQVQEVAGEKIFASVDYTNASWVYAVIGGFCALALGFAAKAKGAVIWQAIKNFFS